MQGMLFRTVLLLTCLVFAPPAFAQSPAQSARAPQQQPPTASMDSPAIRRWFDLQNVHLTSRFRWVKSNDGRLTSSTHQWQPNFRGRFLIDPDARYSINLNANSGSQFVSGWNNSGGGIGDFAGDFNLKQLFLAAEPVRGLEFQVGGLHMVRGESSEITTYDNDAYIVGQRVTARRAAGAVAQVSATVGHIGDYRTPNAFERLDSIWDVNYGQVLVGARLGALTNVSADYTYEDGRDLIREGVTVRMPADAWFLRSVKLEAYQRVSDVTGQGFALSGDLRLTSRFTATAGVVHIDRSYLIPGYMSPNADRYERGTRFYSTGSYQLTRDLSIGWFHGEAFNVDYVIPNEHRWEVIVMFNPTATLKAKGIF
jgi:hypothetical protein